MANSRRPAVVAAGRRHRRLRPRPQTRNDGHLVRRVVAQDRRSPRRARPARPAPRSVRRSSRSGTAPRRTAAGRTPPAAARPPPPGRRAGAGAPRPGAASPGRWPASAGALVATWMPGCVAQPFRHPRPAPERPDRSGQVVLGPVEQPGDRDQRVRQTGLGGRHPGRRSEASSSCCPGRMASAPRSAKARAPVRQVRARIRARRVADRRRAPARQRDDLHAAAGEQTDQGLGGQHGRWP